MSPTLLLGGLGTPHDDLAAAALRSLGHDAATLGILDNQAAEAGRALLGKGHCAPALFTTGGLVRTVAAHGGGPLACVVASTCGPCRYALFEPAWRRALALAGLPQIGFISLTPPFGRAPDVQAQSLLWRVVDALLLADVLAQQWRSLAPHAQPLDALDAAWGAVVERVCERVSGGASAVEALCGEQQWHAALPMRPWAPLARAVLLGDPWSLHVQGDGQMNLPRVLARAGMELDVPPLATWISYLLWQVRQPPWGNAPPPDPSGAELAARLEAHVPQQLARLSAVLEASPLDVPDMDELAALAAPHLPSGLRGGYGHVEVGLAARAVRQQRAHLVLSVKSFGCMPSAVVADEIVPTVLAGALPFLAVEVCGGGEAARESRLMLRVAAAQQRARMDARPGPGPVGGEVRHGNP